MEQFSQWESALLASSFHVLYLWCSSLSHCRSDCASGGSPPSQISDYAVLPVRDCIFVLSASLGYAAFGTFKVTGHQSDTLGIGRLLL